MTSWLVRSTPERAIRVQAVVTYIVLYSWQAKTLYSHSSFIPSCVQSKLATD